MEAFYILGALDNRLNYLYRIEPTLLKLLPLTPSSSSILWTLATKEKLQMQIVYTWLGKNYDKVDDGIVFFFFLVRKMDDEIVVHYRLCLDSTFAFFFSKPILLTFQSWIVYLCTVHGPTNTIFQPLFH